MLTTGNIRWSGPGGDATGVATDQQGNGTVYQYFWPCCGGGDTDFFQVNGVGRTFGLLQASGGFPTPDPQWPFTGGANFAVNPLNSSQIMISSAAGRIFSTETQGVTWFDIGEPSVFGASSFSVALAYGAPDPNAPGGIGNLGNFMYVGTGGGRIFISQTGGGASGNSWTEISTGLSGGAVQPSSPTPTGAATRPIAVTPRPGCLLHRRLGPLVVNNPTNTHSWVNITGNIHNIPYTIFGQSYDPTTDPNGTKLNQAQGALLDRGRLALRHPRRSQPARLARIHPVLYCQQQLGRLPVDRQGEDLAAVPGPGPRQCAGRRWLSAPRHRDRPRPVAGQHRFQTGRAQPGRPVRSDQLRQHAGSGPPAGLDATAVARSRSGWLRWSSPAPSRSTPAAWTDGTSPDGTPLVNTATPTIDGLSSITGFKNATRITIKDVSDPDPANGRSSAGSIPATVSATNVAANWTDANGNFKITTYSGLAGFTTNGPKTMQIYATDDAGADRQRRDAQVLPQRHQPAAAPAHVSADDALAPMRPSDDSGGRRRQHHQVASTRTSTA